MSNSWQFKWSLCYLKFLSIYYPLRSQNLILHCKIGTEFQSTFMNLTKVHKVARNQINSVAKNNETKMAARSLLLRNSEFYSLFCDVIVSKNDKTTSWIIDLVTGYFFFLFYLHVVALLKIHFKRIHQFE